MNCKSRSMPLTLPPGHLTKTDMVKSNITVSIIIVSFLLSVVVSSSSAQTPLKVEWKQECLSIIAEGAPLALILREVASHTGIEILGLEGLEETVSVRFVDLPLREALEKLLSRVNYALVLKESLQEGMRPILVIVLRHPTTLPPEGEIKPDGEGTILGEEQGGSLPVLLTDPDPGMRRWAVERLGEKGDEQAFARLVEALEDKDSGVRGEALAGLGQYGPAALEPVKALLHREQDPEVRAAALHLLGQVGREDSVELLHKMLADQDPPIRIAAVEALGFTGSTAAVDALKGAMWDGDVGVRIAALRTLALYVRDSSLKTVLEQSLYDRDEAVRSYAADLSEILMEKVDGKGGAQ